MASERLEKARWLLADLTQVLGDVTDRRPTCDVKATADDAAVLLALHDFAVAHRKPLNKKKAAILRQKVVREVLNHIHPRPEEQ